MGEMEENPRLAVARDVGFTQESFVLKFLPQRTACTFLLRFWIRAHALFPSVAVRFNCRAVLHFPACSGSLGSSSLIDFNLCNK